MQETYMASSSTSKINNSPSTSPLNPVPKSTEEIKKELKKAISTERKIKRMSPRTSKSTLNEKTIKQGMIENMLQRTALLSPAPAFEKRRPAQKPKTWNRMAAVLLGCLGFDENQAARDSWQ